MRRLATSLLAAAALTALASPDALGAPPPVDDDEAVVIIDDEPAKAPAAAADDDDEVVIDDGESNPTDRADDVVVIGPDEAGADAGASIDMARTLFTGAFETRAAVDLGWEGGGEDVFDLSNRLILRLEYEPDPAMKVVVGGWMTHWLLLEGEREADDPRAETFRAFFDGDLGEAYALWRLPVGLDVAVGRRIFSWGRTDFARPLNVLNPKDLRGGPLASATRTAHIPVWSVEAVKALGPVTLSVIWIPFFEPHRYDLFGTDWAALQPKLGVPTPAVFQSLIDATDPSRYEDVQRVLQSTKDPPGDPIRGADVGARLTATVAGVDMGLAWAYQWDRVPVYRVDPERFGAALEGVVAGAPGAPAALAAAFVAEYERRHVLGADFNVTAGAFSFKGDVAFSDQRTFYTSELEAIRSPSLAWAFQVDFMHFPIFDIGVEVSHLLIFDLPEGTDLVLVDASFFSLTWLLSARLGVAWAVSIGSTWGITAGDMTLSPRVTWRASGTFSLDAGVGLFFPGSDELSVGAVFDDADYVYLNSTVSF